MTEQPPERFRTDAFDREGFVWYGARFYLFDPLSLILQVICFLFGHKMILDDHFFDQIYHETSEYHCEKCGQVAQIVTTEVRGDEGD